MPIERAIEMESHDGRAPAHPAGHKQVGKRFVTPFNQMELVKETHYVERIMPELLWMDMINDLYGYRHGIETTMSLCSQAPTAKMPLEWFASQMEPHINNTVHDVDNPES